MTSHTEGSPQVIKEALACGCPIVSVDVGDVRERIQDVPGCYVSESYEPSQLAYYLEKALNLHNRINGLKIIKEQQLDNTILAKILISLYEKVIQRQ